MTPSIPRRLHLARVYGEKKRNFVGQHFRARGYYLSTVGRGWDRDSRVHPEAGAAGQALEANQSVSPTGHRAVAQEIGAALATTASRFERLTI